MKRAGLRVRTGVRAPAQADRLLVGAVDEALRAWLPPLPTSQPPLVPLIRCAARTKAGEPCGVCWYCKRHDDDQPNGTDHFAWERPF